VSALLVLTHIRRERRSREELDGVKRHAVNLIRAIERQREPLNRLVAMSQQGSEARDEAVTALRLAKTASEEVVRVHPELKPDEGARSSSRKPRGEE
jgi:hypothetical protein